MGAGVSKNESSEKVLDAYYDRVYRFLEPKKYRYKVLYGGRGSGKSHLIAACLLLIAQNTKVRVLCAREIQNSIRDSVWRLLKDKISDMGWDDRWEVTNEEIRCLTTGSEFIFKGLRNNPSIKSTEGISLCWCEEGQLISQESWNVLIPTIRGAGSEIWISFNPDVEETPVWQMFVAHHRDNALVEKVNWDGNPWFPEELREEKDYLYRVDPGMAANVWGGELRSNTNASIFKGKYAIEAFPDDLYQSAERLFFGADFGFANDPSALVRCFIIDKVLYIDYEAYGFGVEITELAKLFRTVPDVDKWTIKADCARPETISHLAKVDHLNIVAAPKWKESVREGIEFIRSFEKVIIHPRCVHTADEFRHYSWKTDRITGEILNVPEDKNNHCVAQGVLVSTDRGDVPVESVTTDDKVLTRDGFKRVLASVLTGRNREVLEIATDSCVLTCTPDHRIYTVNRGFVEAQTLTNEDILLCALTDGMVIERIRSVKNAGICPNVYDLTVQDKPEFFAGGILVHNCIDSARYSLSDYIQHKGQRIHPSNLRLLRR